MSSSNKTTSRGGKGSKTAGDAGGKKTDGKTDTGTNKSTNKSQQPQSYELTLAQIKDRKSDDPTLKDKVKQVMDTTFKSEEEVCLVLHDCDYDMDKAVIMLLEGHSQGAYATSVKKKKNRQTSTSKTETGDGGGTEDWDATTQNNTAGGAQQTGGGGGVGGSGSGGTTTAGTGGGGERERSRNRGGAPPRLSKGRGDSRGWRGREGPRGERGDRDGGDRTHGDDGRGGDNYRRGGGRMSNGPGRGGGGGRGGRGGRTGPRTYQPRDGGPRGSHNRNTVDTWEDTSQMNSQNGMKKRNNNDNFPQPEEWDNEEYRGTLGGVDTWEDTFPQPEDWDNEEYTGSLADTKVFTPSQAMEAAAAVAAAAASLNAANAAAGVPDLSASMVVTSSTVDKSTTDPTQVDLSQHSTSSSAAAALTQALEMRATQQQVVQQQHVAPVHLQQPQSTTLTAAQSQYLSQLTQQNSDSMKVAAQQVATAPSSYQGTTNQYTASAANAYSAQSYGPSANSYGGAGNLQDPQSVVVQSQQPTQQQRTKTQRARVPPPSKIPASAVEMPGDLNSIGFLDVQFGGMDLVSDTTTFDDVTNKYTTSSASVVVSGGSNVLDNTSSSVQQTSQQQVTQNSLDLSSTSNQTPSASVMDSYSASTHQVVSSKQQVAQSNISTALGQNQILSNTDSISQTTNDHLSSSTVAGSGYTSSSRGVVQSNNAVQTAIETVNKSTDVSHNTYSQPQSNSYQSYQSQKSSQSAYQTPAGYNTTYSTNTQVTSSASSYPTNQSTNSYSNSQTSNSGYNQSTVNNSSSYQTNSYQTASSYQNVTPAFSSISNQPTSSFPSNNQSSGYQTNPSQSVYAAAAAGINNTNSYPNQYNSYNTQSTNHKLTSTGGSSAKDVQQQVQYDTSGVNTGGGSQVSQGSVGVGSVNQGVNSQSSGGVNQANVVSSVNTTPTLAALSQTTTSVNTKVTTTSTAKSGVVPNIPPGVAPMMGTQYIMGQAGMPFYQQPVYSFEELQLLQQRIPHMTTGYYDIPYQAPTSLATGAERGASLASVAYSMSDGRFTRADNNASPVPSTISQQISTTTQAHQAQPMLNATALPPGYAYFYNTSMMPGGYQYGTPAIYSQMPTATNAHGSTTSQYPKPGSYGSGYNSAYDALSQSQDYNKSAYVGGPNQSQNKAGVAVTTGSSATDLTSMYGKSHVALGKVNSYDKQGFHSGTPPPFNLAGSQSAGLAPSGQYTPHLFIPTMAPHQTHHSTTLMHQPLHQDTANSSGQRSQTSSQAKPGSKQAYQTSYWNQA
ncbi:protein lingerer isoform X2 [Chrysoperla carnea]|uniref:protein lingerer isoform X2 n=1 Tax=Chrysoperla carnea TaxID=189513 RepID=UPI001D090D8B|nr:protein lingerer isoform X2 [Chrysoperla carnea]